jgi:Tfp pilus assembly protein PilP
MTRTVAIGLFVAVTSASGAAAQTPAPPATPAPAAATGAPAVEAGAKTPSTEAALSSHGFTYTAEGRRDPFVTLLRRGSDTASTTVAARAAGLAGLGASEVTLRGILASQGAYVAMLLGADEKTYIVRSGDKLADGTIRTITADAMVIDQQVNDPLSTQKQREVRKMLKQTDGTN